MECSDGDWTILRFGHVNTGVKNKPAPPEATGFECDKLSPAGAEQHFAGYIGRLSAPGGPADQGRLQGMLIDSWECFTQTWTPAMEREFADRRGYALRQHLPTLAGYVMEDQHTSERFLRDWRKTISDMLVENYFGRLADLAGIAGCSSPSRPRSATSRPATSCSISASRHSDVRVLATQRSALGRL